MNPDPIMKELLEENVRLRKANSQMLSYNFQVVSLSKPAIIRGVLIAEGVWKGIKYSYEEMKKAIPEFEKITMLVDHGHTKEFGDVSIGKMRKVVGNDMLRAIMFEAEVFDERAIPLVANKSLDSVSIKGQFNDLNTKISPPEGSDYKPMEFSLTSSPACDFCTIFNMELTKDLIESKTKGLLGDNIMENKIEGTDGKPKSTELADTQQAVNQILQPTQTITPPPTEPVAIPIVPPVITNPTTPVITPAVTTPVPIVTPSITTGNPIVTPPVSTPIQTPTVTTTPQIITPTIQIVMPPTTPPVQTPVTTQVEAPAAPQPAIVTPPIEEYTIENTAENAADLILGRMPKRKV